MYSFSYLEPNTSKIVYFPSIFCSSLTKQDMYLHNLRDYKEIAIILPHIFHYAYEILNAKICRKTPVCILCFCPLPLPQLAITYCLPS